MKYNYLFEISAIFILAIILFDYKIKMKVSRRDGIVFKFVIFSSLSLSVVNLISSELIDIVEDLPLWVNISVATFFFVLQAIMIFSLVNFSFCYMNSKYKVKSWSFVFASTLLLINIFIAISTPWTHWYFYFDENLRYIHGPLSDLGFYFYYINVFACLIYAVINRGHLLSKDLKVAGVVAIIVMVCVTFQFNYRSILIIGFGMAVAILYLYITLENPNDYQDKLTLCSNNYGLKIYINEKSNSTKPYTIVMIDINKFRYINALYGLEEGNLLLQKIANYLESTFSSQLVFRVDDDVFAVVFNKRQSEVTTEIEQITERFNDSWTLSDGREIEISIAIISCEYPTHFANHTEFLKLSETMFVKIKGSAESQILIADAKIAGDYRRLEAVEKSLRNALNNHTLQVVYQPIFDSTTGTITSVEALSRLNDEELGFIPPDEFIPVAEMSGTIVNLGFYVLDEVCTFIEEMLLPDEENTIESVHVNMSTIQCVFPDSNERYLKIMKQHNVPPEMIHFEMTESSMASSPGLVKKNMKELISNGVKFSLDDYGTGFANISYLLQFQFDMVKFDKNMVWSYFENSTAKAVMENEFKTFDVIKKDIVVEGIETLEQFQSLKKKNIHLFQGYYFSKPVPADKCVEVMHDWTRNWDKYKRILSNGRHLKMDESDLAEMVVSKLLETDYDSIATIDIETEVAYPFTISESELGMTKILDMQDDTDDIAGGLEDFFRDFCIPEDVERAIEENTMESVKEGLSKSDIYESIYSVDFGGKIERKRAMYAYLDKNHEYLICAVRNITDIYNREKMLIKNAERDLATEVYNKKTAENLISGRLNSYQCETAALFVIDIDNLKNINDKYGHHNGDKAIYKIAKDLQSIFDENDIIGRVGGDEFIAFTEVENEEAIEDIASEIDKRYKGIIEAEGCTFDCSVSIGVAFKSPEDDYNSLFKKADEALYVVKKNGKGKYYFK